MKKLRSQHYTLLALAILSLAAAIAAYVFMYKDAIGEAQKTALAKANTAAASDQALAEKKTETTYEDTAADRALLPSFLVSEDNAVAFIDAVDAVGSTTGAAVSLSSLSSGTDSVTSELVVTATISVSGAWPSVMRAIALVEDLPYALSVKSLSLNASDDLSSRAAQWSASMSVSVLSSP